MNLKVLIIIFISLITISIKCSEITVDPYNLEKDKKRLKMEFEIYKKIAGLDIVSIIFISIENKFYSIDQTSIELNRKNFLKRVFNDKSIKINDTFSTYISTDVIKENLSKDRFIEKYLEIKENYYIIPRKYILDTPFGDRYVKVKEIALASQYNYNFFVIRVKSEFRVYDEGKYPKLRMKNNQ